MFHQYLTQYNKEKAQVPLHSDLCHLRLQILNSYAPQGFGKSGVLNCITSSWWYHSYFNPLATQSSFGGVCMH